MSSVDSKIDKSPIGKLSDEYLNKVYQKQPSVKSYEGVGEDHSDLDSISYSSDEIYNLNREFIQKAEKLPTYTEYEKLAKANITQSLESSNKVISAKVEFINWGAEESYISQTLDLVEYTAKNYDKEQLLSRVEKVPKALNQWYLSVMEAKSADLLNSKKAVQSMILHLEKIFREQRYLNILKNHLGSELSYVEAQLARRADQAHYTLMQKLTYHYLPLAKNEIGIGMDKYQILSYSQLGVEINLEESYHQAVEELKKTKEEIEKISKQINPSSSSVLETLHILDKDSKKVTMKEVNNFIDNLEVIAINSSREILPISDLRFCSVNITKDPLVENPYYLPYFSDNEYGEFILPKDFAKQTWRLPSTFFHETAPGHHLQFVMQKENEGNLTSFQKTLGYNPGFEEGWAFYVENYLYNQGVYQEKPHVLSYLLDKSLRLARVILDISIHLNGENSKIPKTKYQDAIDLLVANYQSEKVAIYEVDRYLTLPAQATAYKIGADVIADHIADNKTIPLKVTIKKLLEKGTRPLSLL